jgi:hypothetical protein
LAISFGALGDDLGVLEGAVGLPNTAIDFDQDFCAEAALAN